MPATSQARARTGRSRRRAVRVSPPTWLVRVCKGNSVTTKPNIHEKSDAYPLRASGR